MLRIPSPVTLLPPGTLPDARLLLAARGMRAFGDGYVSLLLPYYLTLLGYSAFEIGVLVTATLLGSGLATLAMGALAVRYRQRALLEWGAVLMMVTGMAFVLTTEFWPLVLIAAVGTINPSSGDISIFRPLEHALLTRTVDAGHRTSLFARYSLIGYLAGAFGAQAAALPALALDALPAVQLMFLFYGVLGLGCMYLYRGLSPRIEPAGAAPVAPLGKSKRRVYTLAAVFSLDTFATGFAVQSLLALWLFNQYQLSITAVGTIFFWTAMVSAVSQLFSAPLARRIGLINTMVYTHLISSVFLILVPLMPNLPLALLCLMLCRAMSQMDVPARNSYVMAVVTPEERPAAASITAVPGSFTSALSPMLAGWLLTASPFGWPLVISGVLKITYDLLMLSMFRRVRPPEEMDRSSTPR
jgi:MFS family permease